MSLHYRCIRTGKVFPFSLKQIACPLCSPYYNDLVVEYNYKEIEINNRGKNIWEEFAELLPNNAFSVSFGETATPLSKLNNLSKKYQFGDLYLKDESYNPTQSFKDRGSFILVNTALENDINELYDISSGNDAISTAAYAQKAKLKCTCIIPENHSANKKNLVKLYGADLMEMSAPYETIFRKFIDSPLKGLNATGGYNPIKEEGIKLIGLEIWKNLGIPDVIIAPCGNGTLLFSIYKAYYELQQLGLVSRLPKLIGVQIERAAPLKQALDQNKDFVILEDIPNSIAESIVAKESYSSPKLIMALRSTSGTIVEVTDKEIIEALNDLIEEESIVPEPTSASVVAALKKLPDLKEKKIVIILTAAGIKNLNEILDFKN